MNRLDRLLTLPLACYGLLVCGVLAALATAVSPGELWSALVESETMFALRFSLLASGGAMIVSALLGVTAAYLLARRSFPGKGLLEAALDIPLVMPPLVAGVGLLFLFGRGLLGQPLADIGIHVVLNPWGAVVAQAFIATPIVLRSAQAAFESVDRGFEETAVTLGLKPVQVFVRVNLPLAGRGIVSGLILAWARTMGEFGATLMVAGATRFSTETLPIAVYLNLASGELGIAVSCALVLLGAAFIMLLVLRLVQLPGAARRGAGVSDLGRT